MKNPRQLSSQAEGEIADLRAAGVELTDADIVKINALCWEIESPGARVELSRGRPVAVGGVWLWPRTIAAVQWFADAGCNYRDPLFSLAYCMANGRGDIETTTEKDVRRWARKLKCTRDELTTAVSAILEQEDTDEIPENKNAPTTSLGELVATMQALHGGDVAMWERYVSLPYICQMLTIAEAQAAADGKSASDVAKQKANIALAYALHKIQKREKEQITDVE